MADGQRLTGNGQQAIVTDNDNRQFLIKKKQQENNLWVIYLNSVEKVEKGYYADGEVRSFY